ncbi:General transcription factor II-I repeat domain-containing protein 2 [Labeo rohita]|uniref:General transcription factor II-I repeat domain-containing protein 2 n=1 Tax=Labeo rohita TaxID=84645 RepID=A0ABQ8M0N9_LABRO|nr:General transcription factor II-I repeat domain-containing protein 2 [Labeo rohita]
MSHVLAKHKKSLKDGKVVKEPFVEAADALFGDFKNESDITAAIKDVQLSRGTYTQQCERIAEDVEAQLRKDIKECECFFLQFDESIDAVDVAQLCVFIRMVFGDIGAKEELVTTLPLKGHTRGEDIFQAFMEFVNKIQLPLFKLIITDGAPAMVDRTNGFITLCIQREYFPDFLNYHCIIHQQALCGKILNMKEVVDVAMKIVCSVWARSLPRRFFHAHLEETEYAQLEDHQWLLDLAYLTNLLNDFNLELQGKDKHVINMISSVNTFKSKLQLLSSRLQHCDLRNFPHMQARTSDYLCLVQVDSIASKIVLLFHLDNSAVGNEILTLQNDIEIKSMATPGMTGEFWNLLPEQKYHNLRTCAFNLTALFWINLSV